MAKTYGEAIAVLQDQMERMQSDMSEVKTNTGKILDSILTMPQQYIPRKEHEHAIAQLHEAIRQAQRRSWVQNTLSAGLGAVFVAIVGAMAYALIVGRTH